MIPSNEFFKGAMLVSGGVASLKLTASLPLKSVSWKTIRFLLGRPIFRGELLVLQSLIRFCLGGVTTVTSWSKYMAQSPKVG